MDEGDDDDALRTIFGYLPVDALLRAGTVCRRWRRIIHDPAKPLLRVAFANTWGLTDVSGSPKSLAFFANATRSSFVHEYSVERGDTVASIAVRHGMGLGEVRSVCEVVEGRKIIHPSRADGDRITLCNLRSQH